MIHESVQGFKYRNIQCIKTVYLNGKYIRYQMPAIPDPESMMG